MQSFYVSNPVIHFDPQRFSNLQTNLYLIINIEKDPSQEVEHGRNQQSNIGGEFGKRS